MYYYINNKYEDGHVDYIESPRILKNLIEITQEEYEEAIAKLLEEQ